MATEMEDITEIPDLESQEPGRIKQDKELKY